LASISCNQSAQELLDCCLRREAWPHKLLLRLAQDDCSCELIRVVAEGLADRFEPALCDTYAALFSEAIAAVEPAFDAAALLDRYRRVRRVRAFGGRSVRTVFVLSRITLGADVAISSVILDAVKQRFPAARIFMVGGRKSWELFAADPRIEQLPVAYPRGGSLRERLGTALDLRCLLAQPDSITIDPDSRLTQLGLIPVCPEEDYFFFESRAAGAVDTESLGTLTRRWVTQTFGVRNCAAYIAPLQPPEEAAITVSLGVGENPAKRIGDPFEAGLVAALARTGQTVLIDKGAGGEEAARVERAMAGLGGVRCWEGSFAGFAAAIAKSGLYVGYDSAGQHVAAACGVPLVSVFAGFPAPRMFHRWRPVGPGPIEVVRVENEGAAAVLQSALDAIERLSVA
jgi:ADP-heptose:LPS heptosyltransferase